MERLLSLATPTVAAEKDFSSLGSAELKGQLAGIDCSGDERAVVISLAHHLPWQVVFPNPKSPALAGDLPQ